MHAVPHQSRPLRGAPASPRGKPRGLLRIRPRPFETIATYCNPSVRPLGPASSPFRGAFLAAPFGGSAATAAKGVPLVILSCYHSTNHTPSVSPYGLPAPPSGSQGELYEFARDFIKTRVPAAPLSRCGGSSPFRGAKEGGACAFTENSSFNLKF